MASKAAFWHIQPETETAPRALNCPPTDHAWGRLSPDMVTSVPTEWTRDPPSGSSAGGRQ